MERYTRGGGSAMSRNMIHLRDARERAKLGYRAFWETMLDRPAAAMFAPSQACSIAAKPAFFSSRSFVRLLVSLPETEIVVDFAGLEHCVCFDDVMPMQ